MATINEDYVSFETAKLLKKKGFDWKCFGYYVEDEPDDIKYSALFETNSDWEARCCSAPTLQMAMKWLREVHRLFICVEIGVGGYAWNITNTTDYVTVYVDATVGTYEKVCEAAIKYCLENII